MNEKRRQLINETNNPNFITKFESVGQKHCYNCRKILVRGIDIDIMCNPCWDSCLMPIEEDFGEVELLVKELADNYIEKIKSAKDLDEQNRLVQEYNRENEKLERDYIK